MNRKQIKRPELPAGLPPLREDEAADEEFTAGEFSGLEDPEYNHERAQEALNHLKEKDPGKWKPIDSLTNK